MKRLVTRVLSLFAAIVASIGAASASVPAAGTSIHVRAEAIYINTSLNALERIFSNTVTVTVNAVSALKVETDQTNFASLGLFDRYVFFAENIGNTDLSPTLSLNQSASDDYDVQNVEAYRDLNANSLIDAGEPQIVPGVPFALSPGERATFVVSFQIPAGPISEGSASQLDFVVSDTAAGVTAQATGTAIVSQGGLNVFKRANLSTVSTGETLRYTVSLRNNGTAATQPYNQIESVDLIVDGLVTDGVLFRDDIPQYTRFESIDQTVTFTALYHLHSAPDKHTYQTAAPADPNEVEAVAFIYDPDDDLSTADPFPAGFSIDVEFTVRVNQNTGSLLVRNRAETYQPFSGGLAVTSSNVVETPIAGPGGTLRFVDAGYALDVERIPTNANTYVEIDAGICNLDPSAAETASITIITSPDDDREVIAALETAPNSGLFRTAAIPVQDQSPAVQSNGVVSGLKRTIALAATVCGGRTLSDSLIINDGGFVFHAVSNNPIANATVTLYDAGGAPFAMAITDVDGFYQFIDLAPGTYTLSVVDPGGLAFPSQRLFFPGFDRVVDPEASYGRPFTIPDQRSSWGVAVPLDLNTMSALTLVKSADRDEAEYGDFIEYSIEAINQADAAITGMEIEDMLPAGFAYVEGSARLDGASVGDPSGGPGPALTFDLSGHNLPALETYTLTYAVRVLPSAGEGERINAAVAEGLLPGAMSVESNVARHRIEIDNSGGVFASEGVVVGKVWLDVNGNGVQDSYTSADVARNDRRAGLVPPGEEEGYGAAAPGHPEPGVAGVRIYLQDGRSVVTDEHGLYSLPGLAPRTHVFVIDRATLPAGTSVQVAHARDALGPGSRFIDLKKGELRSESFPVGPGTSGVLTAIGGRDAKFEGLSSGDSALRTGLPLSGSSARPIGASQQGELSTRTQIVGDTARNGLLASALPELPEAVEVPRTVDLEAIVQDLSSELAFIDLEDGMTVSDDHVSIRVKGPAELGMALEVNGARVSGAKVGQRTVYAAGNVQAAEFVAVKLSGGANIIRLVQTDPFGNDRGGTEITVFAPGQPVGLDVIVPAVGLADPSTPLPVVVRVVDADGRLTGTPIEVTLDATRGHFDVSDIRDAEPGIQAYIDNGEAVFDYVPPTLAGTHRITVSSSLGSYDVEVRLTPNLNARMAAGIIEGAVRFGEGGQDLASLVETDGLSPFEDTVEGVRGALYLKGRIRGDALLTLRYDSDRDAADRLFRDVKPDDYYPVYGDNSERGFDAQSDSELFVKVEKGLSYVLYGDINIAPRSEALKLGGFNRSVTGGQAHLETDRVRVDLFAAYTDQSQLIREIRARGVSGPYDVDLDGYVENSEVVEIITYDRDQPSVELRALRLTRHTDYTLDFFGDAILFNRPIASIDGDLNPQFIRITYETRDGEGDRYWIYGGEVGVDVTDDLTVGYREVRAEGRAGSDDRRTVRAGYAQFDMGRHGTLEVEAAQTVNGDGKRGEGYRAEYEVKTKRARLTLKAADTGEDFDAPGASVAAGRREVDAEIAFKLTDRLSLEGEALYSFDKLTDEARYGVEARVESRINSHWEVTGGTRYVFTERRNDDDDELWSGIIGVTHRPASRPGASIRLEYEQDFTDWGNRRFLFDSSYRHSDKVRVYNKSEWSTSGGGEFGLRDSDELKMTSRSGLEISWSDQVKTSSEYREGSNISDGGVANSIDWGWTWRKRHRLSAGIEHVEPVEEGHERNTAVTLGYRYQNEDDTALVDGQVEWNRDHEGDANWYASLGVGQRFGDWTVLAENRFAHSERDTGARIRNRMRAGYAFRPTDTNDFVSLGWYGLEYDSDEEDGTRALIHTWSLGAEYQARPDFKLRLRHAGRVQDQLYGAIDANSAVLMANAGVEWEPHERVLLGANGSVFWDDFGALTYGVGGEVGFVPRENVLVSVGYNWAGIDEDKIRDIHRTGFFLRVRAKIDENVWDLFDQAGISGR